jgi:DnaK suppressor protein
MPHLSEAERAEIARLIDDRLAVAETERSTAAGGREDIALDQQSVGRLSRMDAIQRREMARATAVRREAEIRRLHAARGRLDDPEFGICAACGEAIGLPRLRIDPALIRCAECTRSA